MIEVSILEGIAEEFGDSTRKKDAFRDTEGYLKVDEMWAAVGAKDDIIAFVRIDVNYTCMVYLAKQLQQTVKEIVGKFFIVFFQCSTRDVLIYKSCRAVACDKARCSVEVIEVAEDRDLV